MRKALERIVSIAVVAIILTLMVAPQILPTLLKDQLTAVPTWVWLVVVGGNLAFLGWSLFNPKARRQWRENREAAREHKRKLTDFELH